MARPDQCRTQAVDKPLPVLAQRPIWYTSQLKSPEVRVTVSHTASSPNIQALLLYVKNVKKQKTGHASCVAHKTFYIRALSSSFQASKDVKMQANWTRFQSAFLMLAPERPLQPSASSLTLPENSNFHFGICSIIQRCMACTQLWKAKHKQ